MSATTIVRQHALVSRKGTGWRPDRPDFRDRIWLPGMADKSALPPEVRLDETEHMPDVYDQEQLGSCTANGSAAAVQFDQSLQGLEVFMPSRLFIYYQERVLEHTVDTDSGAQIRDAVKVLVNKGAPPESDWPYEIASFADKPPAAVTREASKVKATSYQRLTSAVEHWRAALAASRNIIIGFTVYESFEGVGSDGIMPMPSVGEKVLGGHCVLICGYAVINGTLYWRLRNSWGTSWADGGYCWMPASYTATPGLASDFWTVNAIS